MVATESTSKLSNILGSLSDTFSDFRSENAELESEFFALIDEVTECRLATAVAENTSDESVAIAVERLESLDKSIAEQREEFADQQSRLTDDVGQLRELVDQQLQLFAAWIKTASDMKPTKAIRQSDSKKSSKREQPTKVQI